MKVRGLIPASILISFLVVISASAWAAPPPQKAIATGIWGGDGIRLDVDEASATFALDCTTTVTFDSIAADEHGQFRTQGRSRVDGPGPSREPDPNGAPDATLTGSVSGDTMHVQISLPGEKKPRTYTLVKGRKTKLLNCR